MRAKYLGSALGATLLWDNPATTSKSMIAKITSQYCSGIEIGDSRGAYLSDTTAETITASGELVTNGTFTTDTTGWTTASATFVMSGAAGLLTATATTGRAYQSVATVVGKTYYFQYDFVSGTNPLPRVYIGTAASLLDLGRVDPTATGTYKTTFVATTTTSFISLETNSVTAGQTCTFDNISVKLADPDRSVKNTGLILNGSLTKTAVASGAGLVAYSGFSAANYLEQPYNANLDFGTGDFCVMGWVSPRVDASGEGYIWRTAYAGTFSGSGINLGLNGTNKLSCSITNNGFTTSDSITATNAVTTGWHHFIALRRGSSLELYIDGVAVATPVTIATATASLSNATATCMVGKRPDSAWYAPPMALWRISATAPSADQIAHIYRTELPLFQANAQCTIAGTSTAVTALAYDDAADTLHVGTSWGRSSFRDLLRVDSEATTTGALTSLSANQGAVLTGGATSAKFYQPAMLLRDELRRNEDAKKALGKVVQPKYFTATALQTTFVLPIGYDAKWVYINGLLKTPTTDYTISDDGFKKTVTTTAGVPLNQVLCVMTVRS